MNRNALYKSAKKNIPGISQLFGKRPELSLPGNNWPIYYSKAKGVSLWDLKGKKYLDFSMVGVGTSVLGYADKDIVNVAKKVLTNGNMTTLNPPEDVYLAKEMIKLHPWAGGVKYTRTGGESMAVAIRIARTFTGKEKILFCGYHGWHDWYLAANLKSKSKLSYHLLPGITPKGVPKYLKDTIIPFRFNSIEDLKNIVEKNAKNCAAIVLEPARETFPDKNFLKKLRIIASKNNTVLIFDEITSGWRMTIGGIHKLLGINPDLVIYGKTIANGIPMGVIIGKKKIMNSSLNTFISSAFWTERLGPACALEFIKKFKKNKVHKKLIENGKKIKNIWIKNAKKNDLNIEINGVDALASFKIKEKNWTVIITYFIQEMLIRHSIIANSQCYANYMHTDTALKKYDKAVSDVFYKIKKFNEKGILEKKLLGPIKQMGFNRLTKKK